MANLVAASLTRLGELCRIVCIELSLHKGVIILVNEALCKECSDAINRGCRMYRSLGGARACRGQDRSHFCQVDGIVLCGAMSGMTL
jgi:hypothetical protein